MNPLSSDFQALLNAVAFSARVHQGQFRADERTPYASHPTRVGLILSQLFGVRDPAVLTVALLHDTLEDTTVDFDDLAKEFGVVIARDVAALSKDSRLPEPEREEAYCQSLTTASAAAQLVKLGDIVDNLLDSTGLSDKKRLKTITKVSRYLEALTNPSAPVRTAAEIANRVLRSLTPR